MSCCGQSFAEILYLPEEYVSSLNNLQGKTDNRLMPEKKSQSSLGSSFMSAMNGATRLRYGKRANPSLFNQLEPQIISYKQPSRWFPTAKRMAFSENLPALVDSLNGAERLRFGRK